MKPSPIIQSAWRLLDLILQEEPPSDAMLAQALDELALAYHETPQGAAAQIHRDAPARDSASLRAIVAERLLGYGTYAIDDLVDIVGDLAEAVWRFDHLGEDDAHWYLRRSHSHWGRHLRELSLYLHARRFG